MSNSNIPKLGYVIIIMLALVFAIIIFYLIKSNSDDSPSFVCNHLIEDPKTNQVYPPLKIYSDNLIKNTDAEYMIYSDKTETRSDKKLMKETGGIIFCGVPAQLCETKEQFTTPSYCLHITIELSVVQQEFLRWYKNEI